MINKYKQLFTLLSITGIYSIPDILLNVFNINVFYGTTHTSIYVEFWNNMYTYIKSFSLTLVTGFVSLLFSLILGVGFGFIIGYKNFGVAESVFKFIWSLPLIAVSNYLFIFLSVSSFWFAVITGVFLGVFPILSFTFRKCTERDDKILNMVASFNLTKWQEFKYFRWQEIWDSHNINTVLAQSVPLTYVGVTMGEYLVGNPIMSNYNGLGTLFHKAMTDVRYDRVYITMFLMMTLVYFTGLIAEEFPRLRDYFKSKFFNI
ncbi:MAG: hypothetical protein QXW79_03755 [Thermoplasmata archaeon]